MLMVSGMDMAMAMATVIPTAILVPTSTAPRDRG